jgi:hypothetical protein
MPVVWTCILLSTLASYNTASHLTILFIYHMGR